MSEANEIWSRASQLHQQGKLAEALAAYDAILAGEPRHAAALHYSGVVFYQTGKLAEALDRLRASVAIDGRDADTWSNLGLVLQAIGHRRAAVEVFEKAAQIAPESPEILCNLASGLSAEDATQRLRRWRASDRARRPLPRRGSSSRSRCKRRDACSRRSTRRRARRASPRTRKATPG